MFPLFKNLRRKGNLCTWCASSWSTSAFLCEVGFNESSTKEKNLYLSKIHWKIQITHRNQYLLSIDPFVMWPPTHTGNNTLAAASVQSPPLLPSCSRRPIFIPWWNHDKHQQKDVRYSYKKRTVSWFRRLEKKWTTSKVVISPVVRVVSIHCINCIRSIVDGFFVIVISVVAVCCVKDIVVIVNDVNNKEKTRLKQWQQPCEQETQEDPSYWFKGKSP